jgi:ribose/xylose/arabinose/galactoside ABC-type transport system permease subunit
MAVTKTMIQRYAVLGVLLLLFVGFSVAVDAFFTFDNLTNLLVQSTVLGVVGFGLAIVMLAGEIDISFAGSIPLAGSIFALLVKNGTPLGFALLAAIGLGVVIALLIALLVTQLRLVSFISTIAVMFLLQGVWHAATGGTTIWLEDELNRDIVFGNVGPVPRIVLIFGFLFLILYLLTEQTPFGLRLQAVGEDAEAARTAGISPARMKTIAFVLGGIIFMFGAFLSTARLSGALATSGADLMLPVMTVAFVGQTVLGMGRPNIPGVLLGALLLGMINNAFVLMQLPIWSVPVANGLILMAAIAMSNIGKREIIQISM